LRELRRSRPHGTTGRRGLHVTSTVGACRRRRLPLTRSIWTARQYGWTTKTVGFWNGLPSWRDPLCPTRAEFSSPLSSS
jgi:hypothetical protein